MTRSRDVSAVQNNLGVAIPPAAAGKNAVINGGFDIWQRGTSSTLNNGYGSADRWYQYIGTGTGTYARESTVIPSGSQYSLKFTASAAGTGHSVTQYIETANAIPFAGKTVVLSSQVAASTSVPMNYYVYYSTSVDAGPSGTWVQILASSGGSATPTSTTFVPMVGTYAIPSNAQSLRIIVNPTSTIASGVVVYYGNVQLELGSSATPFSRAGGTIQGELAACQRYYWRVNSSEGSNYSPICYAYARASNSVGLQINFPVKLRVSPTSIDYSNLAFLYGAGLIASISAVTFDLGNPSASSMFATATGLTAGTPGYIIANNTSSAYLGLGAEL